LKFALRYCYGAGLETPHRGGSYKIFCHIQPYKWFYFRRQSNEPAPIFFTPTVYAIYFEVPASTVSKLYESTFIQLPLDNGWRTSDFKGNWFLKSQTLM